MILRNTTNRNHAKEELGERYIGHHLVNDELTCPFTGKTTNNPFHDSKRWGIFNSCEHCNPKGYHNLETVGKAPTIEDLTLLRDELLSLMGEIKNKVEIAIRKGAL